MLFRYRARADQRSVPHFPPSSARAGLGAGAVRSMAWVWCGPVLPPDGVSGEGCTGTSQVRPARRPPALGSGWGGTHTAVCKAPHADGGVNVPQRFYVTDFKRGPAGAMARAERAETSLRSWGRPALPGWAWGGRRVRPLPHGVASACLPVTDKRRLVSSSKARSPADLRTLRSFPPTCTLFPAPLTAWLTRKS